MDKYLVIVPTYNERLNIAPLTRQILEQGSNYHVLIIDDNSPDMTGEIADQLAQIYDGRVKALHNPGKSGLGNAYLQGFDYALQHNYSYIFEMDADFSHKPSDLPRLLASARRSGVAIGSRNVLGGGVENWPWYRKVISRGGSLYSRSVLGLKVHDCTGGFKCFRRDVLHTLNLREQVQSTGFGFQVEVNSLCEWSGYRITEVPIIFADRKYGKSKMSNKIFIEALFMVWRLKFNRLEQGPTRLAA